MSGSRHPAIRSLCRGGFSIALGLSYQTSEAYDPAFFKILILSDTLTTPSSTFIEPYTGLY